VNQASSGSTSTAAQGGGMGAYGPNTDEELARAMQASMNPGA
jgi:hypothetical protein